MYRMENEETDKNTNMIDLTGHWFVYFGADLEDVKIEGSRVITLTGEFDPDELINLLVHHIQDSLPQAAKDIISKGGQRIVIRSFNRIDPSFSIGGAAK